MSEAQQQLNGQHITLHLNLIKVSSSQVFHPSILNFPFLLMSSPPATRLLFYFCCHRVRQLKKQYVSTLHSLIKINCIQIKDRL